MKVDLVLFYSCLVTHDTDIQTYQNLSHFDHITMLPALYMHRVRKHPYNLEVGAVLIPSLEKRRRQVEVLAQGHTATKLRAGFPTQAHHIQGTLSVLASICS